MIGCPEVMVCNRGTRGVVRCTACRPAARACSSDCSWLRQPASAEDHLTEARGYYNQELYELAMKSADLARADDHGGRRGLARALPARTSSAIRQTHDAAEPRGGARGAARHRRLEAVAAQPGRVSRWASASGSSWTSATARPPSSSTPRWAARTLSARRPRPRARLVGDLGRSPRAGDAHAPPRDLPADRRSDGRGAARAARIDRGRLLAAGGGAIDGRPRPRVDGRHRGLAPRARGAGQGRRASGRSRSARADRDHSRARARAGGRRHATRAKRST